MPRAESLVTLVSFSMRPTPRVAIFGQHAEHVAVEVSFAAGFQPRNGHAESDHLPAIERAKHLAADFRGDHEEPQREQVDVFEAPDVRCRSRLRLRGPQRSVSGRTSIILP